MLRHVLALTTSPPRPPSLWPSRRSSRPHLCTPSTLASLVLALLMSAATLAHAQSQETIAEQLNEEGKALMVAKKPAEAGQRFLDAATRSPNPRYFYNLCKAYHFQGMFFEAMEACGNARKKNPDDSLSKKIADLEGVIQTAAKEQNIDLSKPPTQPTDPTNPIDPSNPNPTNPTNPVDPTNPAHPVTPNPQPPRGVPPKDLYAAIAPSHEYVWTVGADFLVGSANFDRRGGYGESFAGVRVRSDYMLSPQLQLGAQGYLDFINIGADTNGEDLRLFNFGGALYKHLCFGSVCATPLAGVQIGALDVASLGENEAETAAFGARLEGGLSYAFGSRHEHVIGLQIGVLAYSKPADTDTLMFNEGGSFTYFGFGYTRRLNTPFGSAPILGLE